MIEYRLADKNTLHLRNVPLHKVRIFICLIFTLKCNCPIQARRRIGSKSNGFDILNMLIEKSRKFRNKTNHIVYLYTNYLPLQVL